MRKAWPYIAAGIALIGVLLLVLFHKQQRQFDGRITLNPTQKIPYGSYVAYELLKQQFPKTKISTNREAPGEWSIPEKDSSGAALLIVMSYFNPTSNEMDKLTAFTQKGNTVFISARQMSEEAQHYFRVKEYDRYNPYLFLQDKNAVSKKDSFSVSLDTSAFSDPLRFGYPGIAYDNSFYGYDSIISYPLGHNVDKHENLLAIRSLKGTFYLHSAPIAFSNLFLLSNNNHIYFEKLMSLIPAGSKYMMWDQYFVNRKWNNDNKDDDKGILYVLLKYKNFRWAFWLSVIVLALYIITEIRRRQRLTPDYTKPANETLAFVSTVGKLYYEKGDHKNLAEKLSVYFLDFVRNKYKLSTNEINADFAKALSLKSDVPLEEITAITDRLINIRISSSVTQQQLMEYHSLLEQFYSIT